MTRLSSCLSRIIIANAVPLLVMSYAAGAEKGEVDPASVSEGLKAIFSYGHGTNATRDRLNANTVSVMSGTIGGTYVQFGADLASVLDDGDKLRVLPIVGRGSVQSIADVLFLRGVDLGIMRTDTLDYLEKKGYTGSIKGQFTYITKLYNEEMHVIAPKSIRKLADLDGKRVAVDLPNGGTFVTAITVFERLGIKPVYAYVEQRIAYEKLKSGELDAVIAVQGTPSRAVSQFKGEGFHLVPIEYNTKLQSDYLPSVLKAESYPSLIAPGEQVDTIAVQAVLAAYNWPAGTDRYRKVDLFVKNFFAKFKEFQQPPFHPKWKEVVLNAPLKGWNRFKPAQDWLDQNSATASVEVRGKFDQFLASRAAPQGAKALTPEQNEALFQQFLDWQKNGQRNARR